MALDFVAGCLGGWAGIVVGHPFDTVKVRLQTQVSKRYAGTINCFTQIVKHETVFGLYKGMLSPMAGVGLINAIIFGVQGNLSRLLEPGLSSQCIAGGVAGAVQSIVCCPMELAKTLVQVQSTSKPLYHGSIDCLKKVYEKNGVTGLYKGMTITLTREIPSFALYFGTFEIFCNAMTPEGDGAGCIGPLGLLLAGGLSGISSWFFTYPIDVVKSRFQADGEGKNRRYQSILDCVKKTYKSGGLHAFSQGLSATILRAFPTNAATLATVTVTLRLARDRKKQAEFA
ncbi:mitochondrial basic amino acids transporter-like [Stylophora pistillata]|uniref:Mitochondrial basic amino acids transporter n=1 Tax=Stylophora pistillata TaxID=50429 RepID=A0A2B4SAG6_STYPI|nr:mitochondrial basic amino acids transporter-like [Stylophora pistillata]PFX26366.1 Mitochondrial carnitine/acylcarnitine carrier protein CACL [Stylophora pistillata]